MVLLDDREVHGVRALAISRSADQRIAGSRVL
jgi:hypothetical protein